MKEATFQVIVKKESLQESSVRIEERESEQAALRHPVPTILQLFERR
jgi:hypothetical protein